MWVSLGFPSSSVVKNSSSNAGNTVSTSGSGTFPGRRNSNPIQYPCLEYPMDRGAWQDAVHRAVRSLTWLVTEHIHMWVSLVSNIHTHTHMYTYIQCLYMCVYIYIYIYIYIFFFNSLGFSSVDVCFLSQVSKVFQISATFSVSSTSRSPVSYHLKWWLTSLKDCYDCR